MDVIELGKLTSVNPVHKKNVLSAMDDTEFGIVIDVNPLQLQNATSPMAVTEVGMLTEFSSVHSLNARAPMETTRYSVPYLFLATEGITKFPETLFPGVNERELPSFVWQSFAFSSMTV